MACYAKPPGRLRGIVESSVVIATSISSTTERTESTEFFLGETKKDLVPFVFSVVNQSKNSPEHGARI